VRSAGATTDQPSSAAEAEVADELRGEIDLCVLRRLSLLGQHARGGHVVLWLTGTGPGQPLRLGACRIFRWCCRAKLCCRDVRIIYSALLSWSRQCHVTWQHLPAVCRAPAGARPRVARASRSRAIWTAALRSGMSAGPASAVSAKGRCACAGRVAGRRAPPRGSACAGRRSRRCHRPARWPRASR
jgi:hypothetical protein